VSEWVDGWVAWEGGCVGLGFWWEGGREEREIGWVACDVGCLGLGFGWEGGERGRGRGREKKGEREGRGRESNMLLWLLEK
jgi:hypothetical protein